MNVLARLIDHAVRRPDSAAIRDTLASGEERTTTWAALERSIASLATRLRTTGAAGDGNVVILSCPNSAEFIAAFLAVLWADSVVMPVHPRMGAPELLRLAHLCNAWAIIGDEESINPLVPLGIAAIHAGSVMLHRPSESDPPPPPQPTGSSRAGLHLQSSGTVGLPRIAVRSGASLDAVAANVAHAAALTPTDEVLACIPLAHSYGVENALLGPIHAGSCIRVVHGFDPQHALRLLSEGVTVFPAVPFMLDALAHGDQPGVAARPLGSLRLVYSAGGRLPQPIAERFRRRFGLAVGQLYGATEIGSVTFNSPPAGVFQPECVGHALPGVRLLILDPAHRDPDRPLPVGAEGHVAVSAPSMLTRYADGAAPITDGYFLTGDLGRLDNAHQLWITGRIKLQIDVGGLKVNPAEVEAALLQHPAVAECAVVAMPLSATISRVRAVVVRAPGHTTSADELREFVGSRLASYKVPRRIEFRDSLPRSPLGKVLRKELEVS